MDILPHYRIESDVPAFLHLTPRRVLLVPLFMTKQPQGGEIMASPTQQWERLECRPLDSGSGAPFVTQSAFKSYAWFILLHHTVSVGAVYIFFVFCERF